MLILLLTRIFVINYNYYKIGMWMVMEIVNIINVEDQRLLDVASRIVMKVKGKHQYGCDTWIWKVLESDNFKNGKISEEILLRTIDNFKDHYFFMPTFCKTLMSENYAKGIISEDMINLVLSCFSNAFKNRVAASEINSVSLYHILNVIFRSDLYAKGKILSSDIDDICKLREPRELILKLYKMVGEKYPNCNRMPLEEFSELCNSDSFSFVPIAELLLSDNYAEGIITADCLKLLFNFDYAKIDGACKFLMSENYADGYINVDNLVSLMSFDFWHFELAINNMLSKDFFKVRKLEIDSKLKRFLDTDCKREIYSLIDEDEAFYVKSECVNKLKLLFASEEYSVVLEVISGVNKLVGTIITLEDRKLLLRFLFSNSIMEEIVDMKTFFANNADVDLNERYVSMMVMWLCGKVKNRVAINEDKVSLLNDSCLPFSR